MSTLDDIRIATPCPASWATMDGDDRRRFCAQCKLHVYNLSAMTRDDAESFLQEREGRVCVRLYRRSDGTLLTQDCPVVLAAAARLRLGRLVAGVLAIVSVIVWGAAATHVPGAARRFFSRSRRGSSLPAESSGRSRRWA